MPPPPTPPRPRGTAISGPDGPGGAGLGPRGRHGRRRGRGPALLRLRPLSACDAGRSSPSAPPAPSRRSGRSALPTGRNRNHSRAGVTETAARGARVPKRPPGRSGSGWEGRAGSRAAPGGLGFGERPHLAPRRGCPGPEQRSPRLWLLRRLRGPWAGRERRCPGQPSGLSGCAAVKLLV